MHNIVVLGGGGYSRVIISILKKIGIYNILGYTDINDLGKILGIDYIGNDSILKSIITKYRECSAAVGIGYLNQETLKKRKNLFNKLEEMGYSIPAIISPQAIINENVSIGLGTIVCDNVTVSTGALIGQKVIINTNSSIDHDCQVGDYVHIAPGVTVSGGVVIGNESFIGTGSTIIQNIQIGKKCFFAAGSLVTKNFLKPGKYS